MAAITVVKMLEQENEIEEALSGNKNKRALARLTLYKFPLWWYDYPIERMGTPTSQERWLTYRVLWDKWLKALGGEYSVSVYNELKEAIEYDFATGRERKFLAEGARRGSSWGGVRKVIAEITYMNYAVDVCETAGLDYSIEALREGVPLEHVFPEDFDRFI